MGGIVGRLFREFAVTLSTAIVVSMVISLTTTPMMCAFCASNERAAQHGRLYRASERVFDSCVGLSAQPAFGCCDIRCLTLMVLLIDGRAERMLIIIIPKGFFPQQDTGAHRRRLQRPAGRLLPGHEWSIKGIGDVIKNDPAVANVDRLHRWRGATNSGFLYVALKPLVAAKSAPAQIINRLRPQVNRLPVASAFLQAHRICTSVDARAHALPITPLQSDSEQELASGVRWLLRQMRQLPWLFRMWNSDQQNGGL